MKNKIISLCMVLAASAALGALAAPASAMQLTHPTGTKLATGGTLLFTNIGNISFKTGSGIILTQCTSLQLTGTLQHNGPEDVTAEVSTATFTGTGLETRCTLPEGRTMKVTAAFEEGGKQVGLPYCLTTTAGSDSWVMRGGACGVPRSIKLKFDFYTPPDPETGIVTLLGTCAYEKANLSGSFTTDTGGGQDAQLTTSEEGAFKRYELSNFLVVQYCPEETKMITSVTMETDTTTSADPLYFS
jgi:hypothetical protein